MVHGFGFIYAYEMRYAACNRFARTAVQFRCSR